MNSENENEQEYECLYCGLVFFGQDAENKRDDHTFRCHLQAVEQNLAKIKAIAEKPENALTIQEWKDSKKKEILLKLSQENPQALRVIMNSPESDSMISNLIEMDLLKLALRTETLSSDIIWMKSPHFEEESEEEKVYEHKDMEESGQSEQTIEIDSPNEPAKKVLEKANPINRVSFKSGKLILQPLTEDSIEELSDKDKSLMILHSIMRSKKKKD